MINVPNIQKDFDNYLYDAIDSVFGNAAPGIDWIHDPEENQKNKHAIIREYQTVGSDRLNELVRGRINTNFGAIIITTTRLVTTNLSIQGKKYGARLETLVYLAAANIRQNQERGNSRRVYEMCRDLNFCLVNSDFMFNNYSLPASVQFAESELTNEEFDVMRAPVILEVARFI